MNKSIQSIFLQKFFFFIVIPILMLIIIGVPVAVQEISKDEEKQLEIMLESYELELEEEIEEGAIRFSQFLLVNDHQVIELMEVYAMTESKSNFSYYTELQVGFNYLLVPDMSIEGVEFYFTNGENYAYKTYTTLTREELQEKAWYLEAEEVTDRVVVAIEPAGQYIPNLKDTEKMDLLFAINLDVYDETECIDVAVMVQESITIQSLRDLESTDYRAYIIDEEDNLVFGTDDEYAEELLSSKRAIFSESSTYKSGEIKGTNWSLVLVKNQSSIVVQYLTIIMGLNAVVIGIFAVFCLFILAFISKIANPIKVVSKTMEQLSLETTRIEIESELPFEIQQIQLGFNTMIDRIQGLVASNQDIAHERYEEELKALQFQMNPHFLSNTLHTIKFMAQVSKHKGIYTMTESLMKIVDCSFRSTESMHTMELEIEMLSSYVEILKIRYAEGIKIEMNMEDACRNVKIPKLVLQPFLENAIFHGLEDVVGGGAVIVNIYNKNTYVEVIIEDNGHGIEPEILKKIREGYESKEGRIGISNVMKRLRLHYSDQYHFDITSEREKGTKIIVQIPKEENPCIQ